MFPSENVSNKLFKMNRSLFHTKHHCYFSLVPRYKGTHCIGTHNQREIQFANFKIVVKEREDKRTKRDREKARKLVSIFVHYWNWCYVGTSNLLSRVSFISCCCSPCLFRNRLVRFACMWMYMDFQFEVLCRIWKNFIDFLFNFISPNVETNS